MRHDLDAQSLAREIPCALFNLKKTTRAVSHLYDEILRPSGLRGTQYTVMKVVDNCGPIGVSELGSALVMDRTTVTRNLRVLVRDRLVQIQPGGDRRRRLASTTALGRRRLAVANRYWQNAQAAVTQEYGENRLARLRRELTGMVEASKRALATRPDEPSGRRGPGR